MHVSDFLLNLHCVNIKEQGWRMFDLETERVELEILVA